MRVANRRVVLTAAAVLVAMVPFGLESRYMLSMLVFIALNALPAVGLSLVMGFAGQVSLGQAAFFAVGAYVSGVLTATHGWNGWNALLLGVVAAAVLAFVVGLPIFRLSGLLLAMATLAFGIIVYYVLVNWSAVTGGPSGLAGVPPLELGRFRFDTDARMLWLTWGSLLVVVALTENLVDSRVGRALRAVHGNEAAAAAVGIDTARLKLAVFVLAAAITALAGGLYAHYLTFINPSPFGFGYSVEMLVMVVLGGAASVWGAVLGAATVVLLGEALRAALPLVTAAHGAAEYEIALFGLLLMAFIIFRPSGFAGVLPRAS